MTNACHLSHSQSVKMADLSNGRARLCRSVLNFAVHGAIPRVFINKNFKWIQGKFAKFFVSSGEVISDFFNPIGLTVVLFLSSWRGAIEVDALLLLRM